MIRSPSGPLPRSLDSPTSSANCPEFPFFPHPKQCQRPDSRFTDKEGRLSSWKGQRPRASPFAEGFKP